MCLWGWRPPEVSKIGGSPDIVMGMSGECEFAWAGIPGLSYTAALMDI